MRISKVETGYKSQFTKEQAVKYICDRYSINRNEITDYTYGLSYYHAMVLHCVYWVNNCVPFTCTDEQIAAKNNSCI